MSQYSKALPGSCSPKTLRFVSSRSSTKVFFIFPLILQKVLKEGVTSCLVDKTTEAAADHVGIWDRPKRPTGANCATGGAYLIDIQNYVALTRNVKVKTKSVEIELTILCLL